MGTPQSHGKKHPWFCHRQVFRQQIWMRHFGVKSQKATCLWSNSWHIQHLDNGPVPKALRDASQPLAKTYHDQGGVKRCTGKKRELKESQLLGSVFIQKNWRLLWESWASFDLWTCCFDSVLMPPISGRTQKLLGTRLLPYCRICQMESWACVSTRTFIPRVVAASVLMWQLTT